MKREKSLIENMHLLSINVRYFLHQELLNLNINATYEMARVLMIISKDDHLNQQQIANMTYRNKASLTSLIENMEKRGLVERKESITDRRNKIVSITDSGKAIVDEIQPIFNQMLEELYQDLTDEEMRLMNGVISKMNNKFIK